MIPDFSTGGGLFTVNRNGHGLAPESLRIAPQSDGPSELSDLTYIPARMYTHYPIRALS